MFVGLSSAAPSGCGEGAGGSNPPCRLTGAALEGIVLFFPVWTRFHSVDSIMFTILVKFNFNFNNPEPCELFLHLILLV